MSDDVEVKFGASIDGAIANINKLTESVEGFGENISSITSAIPELGEVIAAAFGIEKIDEFIEKIGDLGLQVERTSEQLGLSVQQVSLLNYAAQTNDVSTSQMRNSLERLTVGLQTAEEGANKQADAFKQLSGETAQQFIASGGNMNDLIMKIAHSTEELNGKVNLAPSFIALMGRSGADAIPVFLDLGEHMDTLKQKVADAGLAFNGEFIDDIAETRKASIDLKSATDGLGASFFDILKPAIDGLQTGLRGFVQSMQDSLKSGNSLWALVELLTGALLALETVVIAVGEGIKEIFDGLVMWAQTAQIAIYSLADAAYDAAHGNLAKAKTDLASGNQQIAAILQQGYKQIESGNKSTLDSMEKDWDKYWADITQKSKAGNTNLNSDSKTTDPKLGGSNSAANNAAQKAMEEDIQAHKAMLEEELADEGQNLQAKMILEQRYYDWLAQKYPQNANALAAAGKNIATLQNQEVKQSEQAWQGFFGQFNQGINGMLRGTQTFRQSMSSVLLGIVDVWIKSIEKIAAQWIATELVKTSATNAGNAARTASNVSAAAVGKAVQTAADQSSIGKAAATGAANAYASTAAIPIIGPLLAPAAGALAFGAIEAFGSSMPSYAVGTPYVPSTGPAMLHQGEAIIPASMNKPGGLGGNQVHFHVSAIDSQGVANFFNNHGSKIAAQVVDQFKRGNPAFRYPRS